MRKWAPLLAVCLGIFMLLLDVTVVAVALPKVATDLNASLSQLQWIMDAYALALAALLLGAGSTSDVWGRRKVYVLGLIVFTTASLACGLAPNGDVLVAARGVQGVGAAAMLSTALSLLSSVYSGKDRAVAFGVWGAVSSAAAACGPISGGLLTDALNWRWIFLINLPVGVAAIALSMAVVPESKGHQAQRIDLGGLVSFTVFVAAAAYTLIRADAAGWSSAQTEGTALIAAGALAVFVVVERKTDHPLLDLRLFRRPAFCAIMFGTFAMQCASFACLVYASIWLQSLLGLSPLQGGLALLPLAVCSFLVAGATGRLLHGVAPRWTVGVGLLLIGAGGFAQAVLGAGSTWAALVPGLVLVGAGVGLANPAVSAAAMAAAPPERAGMASGAANTFRQLGYALGVAVFGTVLLSRAEHGIGHRMPNAHGVARELSGGGARDIIAHTPVPYRGTVSHVLHAALASGLDAAEMTAGAVGLLGALLVMLAVDGDPRPGGTATPNGLPQQTAAGTATSPS